MSGGYVALVVQLEGDSHNEFLVDDYLNLVVGMSWNIGSETGKKGCEFVPS